MVVTRKFTNITLLPLRIFITIYSDINKSVPLHAKQGQRGGRSIALPILDPSARRGWVVHAMPCRFTPGEKTWYPLYRRLGGPWGHSGRVDKILPPLGVRTQEYITGNFE
jgi:hypothetical protein